MVDAWCHKHHIQSDSINHQGDKQFVYMDIFTRLQSKLSRRRSNCTLLYNGHCSSSPHKDTFSRYPISDHQVLYCAFISNYGVSHVWLGPAASPTAASYVGIGGWPARSSSSPLRSSSSPPPLLRRLLTGLLYSGGGIICWPWGVFSIG